MRRPRAAARSVDLAVDDVLDNLDLLYDERADHDPVGTAAPAKCLADERASYGVEDEAGADGRRR